MTNYIYEYLFHIIHYCDIKLSDTEKEILDLIKNNKIDIINSDTNEISKLAYISKSSITRFSQKLGFKGFSDMKYTIKQNVYKKDASKIELEYKTIVENYDDFNQDIVNLISKFKDFRKICIIGIGSSGIVAKEAHYRLIEIGLTNVNFADEPYNLYLEMTRLNEKDLVIALSLSGENENLIENLKIAKQNKAYIFAVTSNLNSRLSKMSDLLYKVPSPTKEISKAVPLLFFIDLLCNQVKNA